MNDNLGYNQKLMGALIEDNVVVPLKNNKCGLKKEEMYALLRMTCHVEKNISEVCDITHWSARTLERKWKEGDFPKPHKDASEKLYWWLDEIEIWVSEHRL